MIFVKLIFMACFGPDTFVVGWIPMHHFNLYCISVDWVAIGQTLRKLPLCLRVFVAADISAYADLRVNSLHKFCHTIFPLSLTLPWMFNFENFISYTMVLFQSFPALEHKPLLVNMLEHKPAVVISADAATRLNVLYASSIGELLRLCFITSSVSLSCRIS